MNYWIALIVILSFVSCYVWADVFSSFGNGLKFLDLLIIAVMTCFAFVPESNSILALCIVGSILIGIFCVLLSFIFSKLGGVIIKNRGIK